MVRLNDLEPPSPQSHFLFAKKMVLSQMTWTHQIFQEVTGICFFLSNQGIGVCFLSKQNSFKQLCFVWHSQWMSSPVWNDLDSPSLSKNHRELLSVFYPTITIILNSYVLTHSQWTSLPLCVRPSLFVSGPQIEMMQTNFSGNDWCLLLHAFKVKSIFTLLFMCLPSLR